MSDKEKTEETIPVVENNKQPTESEKRQSNLIGKLANAVNEAVEESQGKTTVFEIISSMMKVMNYYNNMGLRNEANIKPQKKK